VRKRREREKGRRKIKTRREPEDDEEKQKEPVHLKGVLCRRIRKIFTAVTFCAFATSEWSLTVGLVFLCQLSAAGDKHSYHLL
jgi:hypothetical protein